MLTADVSVITPAIPERTTSMLPACVDSVVNQTLKPKAHLIGIDYNRVGAGAMCNTLVTNVKTEYIAFLADDDIFYNNHIEVLHNNVGNADLIYSWCNVVGRGDWNPNSYFDADRLCIGNYIPSTVMMRTDVFREFGGFDETPFIAEDWDMWLKMLRQNKVFKCVDEITWEYRFHGSNISDGWLPS
jgi:glycosyltransferase involved in cell wall biosynthesis